MKILLDMVGYGVRDMAAMLRFYRLLGLPLAPELDNEAFAECITANGCRLGWNHIDMVKSFDPEFEMPKGSRVSVGFKCATPAEVNESYRVLTTAGYTSHKALWDAFWGQCYAQVPDIDGSIVDLFDYLT
jgi:uncharacterized glyoxalase superfamily protein PhnB